MEAIVESLLLEGLAKKTKYYRDLPKPLDYSTYDILFNNSKKSRWQGPSPLTVVHIDGYDPVRTVSEFIDERVTRNENLINQTIQYAKRLGLPVPKTKLHIWVSDRQPWMLSGVDHKVPIYVYAAPLNSKFILFPDNSYDCLETSQKYTGSGLNWDQIKLKFNEYHTDSKQEEKQDTPISKQDVIFFKGTPTTLKHSRLREQLYLNSVNDTLCTGKESLFKPSNLRNTNDIDIILRNDIKRGKLSERMVVQLDAWKSYVPVWEFAKYKYLLNLPGHYPWSNRMKYLFMSKSLVINVSVITKGSDYIDEPFETISDYIFKPSVDYLDINMTYFVPKNRHALNTPVEQVTENNRVYNDILSAVDVSADIYTKITNSAYDKANALNLDHIYKYMYHLILFNAEIF